VAQLCGCHICTRIFTLFPLLTGTDGGLSLHSSSYILPSFAILAFVFHGTCFSRLSANLHPSGGYAARVYTRLSSETSFSVISFAHLHTAWVYVYSRTRQALTFQNIELFFCLYAGNWNNPTVCNSSNSRLLGFFSCLPGIWRLLQCFRRYYDTRNVFPHLVNGGKYLATILFYMTLSLYRINKSDTYKAIFIFFGIVNSCYTSVWDVAMDWSLGNPYAKEKYLRDVLGYKTTWPYYVAMVIDPILRFNWIFYAIFAKDVQHSAALSFVVAFSEVLRRGMWAIFRMENEHCTNVGRFRAYRDIPLPYEMPGASDSEITISPSTTPNLSRTSSRQQPEPSPSSAHQTPDVEANVPKPSPASVTSSATPGRSPALHRRRTGRQDGPPMTPLVRAFSVVGNAISQAHAQDFERKRKPDQDADSGKALRPMRTNTTYDDSSDEDEADVHDRDEVERLLEDARRDKSETGNGKQRED
jgi:hypothetical protein